MKTLGYIFCLAALFLLHCSVHGTVFKDTADLTLLVLKGKKTALDATNINRLYLGSAADRLRYQEGIYIKEGSGKMLSSLRVNGSTPAQTAVSWNGLKLNNAFNGQIDINLLPATIMNFGMVKLGSSQLGANSMTGTLLIEQAQFDSQWVVDLNYGSFGTKNINAYKSFNIKKSSHFLSGSAHQSLNDFKYTDYSTTKEQKPLPNAYAEIFNVLYGNQLHLTPQLALNSNFWYTNAFRQLPPSSTATLDSAYQKDESWRGQAELVYKLNKWTISQNNAISIDNLRFVSPLARINSFYKSLQSSNDLKAAFTYSPSLQLFGIISLENQQAQHFFSEHNSFQNYHSGARFVYERQDWVISGGVSKDKYSLGYKPFNYQTSVQKKVKRWVMGYSLGSSFRAPTFNELYWPTGGNEDLLPEHGITHRGKVGYVLPIKNNHFVRFNLSGQTMHFQNQIVWLPNSSNAFWSPINIAETYHLSSSLKITTDYSIHESKHQVSINANYTQANSVGFFSKAPQLIYTPSWSMNGMYDLSVGKNRFVATSQYQSKTFVSADNTTELGGFNILNFRYLRSLPKLKSTLYVGVNNITNRNYEITEKRPMPGINFITGITIKL